ncbi:MAG: TIGR04283 family arsenosugar biosynthesis glycosyltransferase [Chitinophagaceae bacterium]|nr:TIGR04283 family arsenosugar biosynthesis glycosyltransferase [Chitinophagaceae bacterium]
MQHISIIIPTYNEADGIGKLVQYLQEHGGSHVKDIIVSDGGSIDDTMSVAAAAGAIATLSSDKGRAAQMNHGASIATGSIFYFVHADTFPPVTYALDILTAINSSYAFGRYRTKFDSDKKILLFNAWFTRFDLFICYGGDQTLFMQRKLFDQIGGFNSSMRIMEDYDIVTRAKSTGARYKIFSSAALVSARKYDTNSWLRVQTANYTIIRMYKKGASQNEMVHRYRELLNYR